MIANLNYELYRSLSNFNHSHTQFNLLPKYRYHSFKQKITISLIIKEP